METRMVQHPEARKPAGKETERKAPRDPLRLNSGWLARGSLREREEVSTHSPPEGAGPARAHQSPRRRDGGVSGRTRGRAWPGRAPPGTGLLGRLAAAAGAGFFSAGIEARGGRAVRMARLAGAARPALLEASVGAR